MRQTRWLALGCLAAAACLDAPTARNNPLDPEGEVTFSIGGVPDTVRSALEVIHPVLESSVPIPAGVPVTWTLRGFVAADGGGYRPSPVSIAKFDGEVIATIGSGASARTVRRTVVQWQEPASAEFVCDSGCVWTAVGVTQGVRLVVRDALGTPVANFNGYNSNQRVVMRDTMVARIYTGDSFYGYEIRSTGRGSTWFVTYNTAREFSDSVRLDIGQVAWSARTNCPYSVTVGQPFQLAAVDWLDRGGTIVPEGGPAIVWSPGSPLYVAETRATVTPDGLVTATVPGIWQTTYRFADGTGIALDCSFYVNAAP